MKDAKEHAMSRVGFRKPLKEVTQMCARSQQTEEKVSFKQRKGYKKDLRYRRCWCNLKKQAAHFP